MSGSRDPTHETMTCADARDAISARLDGELHGDEAVRLDHHLGACADCAAYAARLTGLNRVLPSELSDDRDTAAIWSRVQTVIDTGQKVAEAHREPSRRRLLRFAIAASVVTVAGGTGLAYLADDPAPDLIAETVNDYLTFQASGGKLHVSGPGYGPVAAWLRERVDFQFALSRTAPSGSELVGGRLCSFLGRRLVFLHFRAGEDDVALYIMRDEDLELQAARSRTAGGRALLTRDLRGLNSAAWQRAGLIYVVVGTMPEDEIIRFAAQV